MAAKRLTERVAAPLSGSAVNREKGFIENVLICGTSSENNRDYPPAVFRRDVQKYEGRVVNCDHGREATVDRRLGWFSDVHPADDGRPRGRLNMLKSHPMYERVMEAAERNPALYGFSHVAMCDTQIRNGRETVEAILSVESIDLVAEPATTKGLFESKGGGPVTTVKKLLESIAARTNVANILRLKRLAEMDGMGDLAVPEPAEAATPEEGITAAFKAGIMAVVEAALSGDADPKSALQKIKKLLDSHGDVNGDGKTDEEDVAKAAADAAEEAKKKAGDGAAILEALAVADKVGFRPDAADLHILAGTAPALRESVAKKLLKAGKFDEGTSPRSAGRHGGAKLEEGKGGAAATAESKTGADDAWQW